MTPDIHFNRWMWRATVLFLLADILYASLSVSHQFGGGGAAGDDLCLLAG